MENKDVKQGLIMGCIPFQSFQEKRKIIHQLRSEFRPNLRIWEENNMITYESFTSYN
ncbi:hypothetical protein [Sporosarcina globispora]|uniref:hypothetical protein n=1 Tax=Sporosarcina globispora TaxID=1459 RepID=UPI000A7ADC30|nr:hypothetical protein [Sporosarcina globispora]